MSQSVNIAANDYVPAQLEQAARESRAYAGVSRAHAQVHAAYAARLSGNQRRVAEGLAKVARLNAKHADEMANVYEAEARKCR